MNAVKMAVMVKEFPFLKEYFGDYLQEPMNLEIIVKRVNPDLLTESVQTRIEAGPFLTDKKVACGKIFFFNKDKKFVRRVGGEEVTSRVLFFLSETKNWNDNFCETIGDAVAKTVKEISYVAVLADSLTEYCWYITIYKAPKGFDLQSWLKKLETDAKNEIDAEISEIDNI